MQQNSDSSRLVVRRGPQPNQTYELSKDVQTIGRDITNDIVINDPEVSRHHLRFTRGGGGFTVEDIGSTNGSYVNGQRLVGAKPLNNGDMIGLGETVTLGYEVVRAAPPAGFDAGVTAPSQIPAAAPQAPNPYAPQPPAAPPQYGAPQQGGQPQYGAPQQGGQPQYGAPQQGGQPQYGAPQQPAGQPQYGAPQGQAGQPQYGAPQGGPQANPAAGQQPPYRPAQPQNQYGAQGYTPANAGYTPPPAYGGQQPMTQEDGGQGDEERSPMRWVLIGCLVLLLLCCCASVIGLVIIDSQCLYNNIPLLPEILSLIGLPPNC
jgi:hypothetical protein